MTRAEWDKLQYGDVIRWDASKYSTYIPSDPYMFLGWRAGITPQAVKTTTGAVLLIAGHPSQWERVR